MVKAQSDERAAQDQQNDRPRTDISVERCGPRGAETLVKPPRKPHQTARGDQFRKVVERSLPADILRLILRREFRHVDAVGRNVVRRPAEGNDRKDSNTDREEQRKLKRQGRDAEQNAAQQLAPHDPELLRPVKLQKRAPQKLDRPWPHDQRGPERDLRIRDPQVLVQNRRNHVQNHKRKTHRKVQTRNPPKG